MVEGHKYDTKCLKYLFVAGEHCDHGTRVWAENQFQVPVLGEKLVLFSSYKILIMSPNFSWQSTVKLGFKERLNKEQIGNSEPFLVTNLPFYLKNSEQIGIS